uniref:Uncharacterized protein n=1 Tax=Myotis myotis TaxID=51298 RepID=A0A7J8ANE0_MYOMY|nr:hypothetical protein mMyoMyo1_008187 [Myotis myotis]
MPCILIATELALPFKMVALKMTPKRNFILNFYESAQYCNYRCGQPISFIKSFPMVHCFQFKRRKFNQHQEMEHLEYCPDIYFCSSCAMISFYLRELWAPRFPASVSSASGGAGSLRLGGPGLQTLFSFPPVQ